VDLAGGTLDIWPLYLLVQDAMTVNAAVSLRASVEVDSAGGGQHRIVAEDVGREIRLDPSTIDGAAGRSVSGLPLHEAVLRHVGPATAVSIRTRSDAPAGSGLGGSSALAVSLLAALWAREGIRKDKDSLAATARDLEAQVLQIPTGTQDHIAALHGGVAAIHYGPGTSTREEIAGAAGALQERGVLAFLGTSRASARANWDMLRRALDGDPSTRRGLEIIAGIAAAMRAALLRSDFEECARLLGAEWQERRGLSPEVSTPETERALAAAGRSGASGGKICGAGGGGCLFVMGPPDARGRIADALRDAGCRLLDFTVDGRGLEVTGNGE